MDGRRTKKEWVVKKPLSPQQKFLYQLPEAMILSLEPKELLSLYLTDKQFNYFNNQSVLNLLYNKYNIKAKTFSDFIKLYNKSLINPKNEYLYQLEYEVELPSIQYVNDFVNNQFEITQKIRAIVIDWMFEVMDLMLRDAKKQPEYMGLVVCYLDYYLSKKQIKKEKLQLVGIVCMYLAEYMIVDDRAEISDYVYITDGAYDREEINEAINDVFTVLNGILIRPTTALFLEMNEETKNLVNLSYIIPDLIKYKSSMIAEAISYILYGTYKIYDLSELNDICQMISKYASRMLKTSLKQFKHFAEKVVPFMKFQCGDEKREYLGSPFKKNEPWHLGDYQKSNVLGKGAYGKVRKIKIDQCTSEYVLKTVDEDNKGSTLMEIALIKQLQQDNIITICQFELNNKVKLILPLLSDSLANMLNKNTFNKNKTDIYFKQLCMGLNECHKNDIIHRDIKPENIMYDGDRDQFKLIDFGISVSYASKRYYLDPNMACTFMYRAPEALVGYRHYNEKVDIWALGATFYKVFTGQFLFDDFFNTRNQLEGLFKVFGTPKDWPYNYDISTIPYYEHDMNKLENIFGKYDFILPCFIYDFNERPGAQDLIEMVLEFNDS